MSELDGRLTLAQHAQLAECFAPGTTEEMVDEYVALLNDRRNIERAIESYKTWLLSQSASDHDGADERFRKGRVLQGTRKAVQAVWRMTGDYPHHGWEPKLEILK